MDVKTEKNVVIWLLIAGFIGGIVLYIFRFPHGIVSVFLAIGVATTIYHFLGGITAENQVNLNWLKLGGSAAVFVGVWLLLNNQLIIEPPDIQTIFNPNISEWLAINENGSPVKLEIKNVDVKGVKLIEPREGFLKNNKLTLYQEGDRYHVVPADNRTFILGNLTESVFTSLGFFQYVQSAKGMLYRTEQLRAGTIRASLRNFLTDKELPFKLTAGNYANGMSGYHLVDQDGKEIYQGELGILQGEIVRVESNYYLISVLEANHNLGSDRSYARFAAYQIDVK